MKGGKDLCVHTATFVLFLNISAAMEGLAKWDHFFQYWLSFSESGGREREGGEIGLRKEEGRETYDRLSHV